MYWINVARVTKSRHLRRLHKLAHQLTSGLFIMCLLVVSAAYSCGFEAGSSSFSGGGSSAGSPGGVDVPAAAILASGIGGGSFSGSIGTGHRSAGSSSGGY